MKELIDELGRLESELAPTLAAIKPKTDRVKELKGLISGGIAEPGEQVLYGLEYGCSVGKAGNERTITSLPRLFRLLGQKTFLSLCSFALGKFDELVKAGKIPDAEAAILISEAPTGRRKVQTFQLAKAEDLPPLKKAA